MLSGNRNFPGRVHPDLATGFLMSPALVVAYALLGDAGQDIESAVLATTADGRAVRLADLMPTDEEVAAATAEAVDAADFPEAFRQAHRERPLGRARGPVGADLPLGPRARRRLRRPPFVRPDAPGARVLLGQPAARARRRHHHRPHLTGQRDPDRQPAGRLPRGAR